MKKFLGFVLIASSLYANQGYQSRAVIVSLDRTIISSEIAGEIVELSKFEGDSFKKGLEFLGYIPTDSIKGIGNGRVVSIDQIDENLSIPNSTFNLVL